MQIQNPDRAQPRTPEEIAILPDCLEVWTEAARRGVKNVVHFTTISGVNGILATQTVMSRKRLNKDQYLEFVFRPNSEIRKDEEWLDYVNLSIERINDWMFGVSSNRWHVKDNNPWALLSFHPQILSHPGVVFATTNNIYPSCLRAEGLAGFCQLYSDTVYGRYRKAHGRRDKLSAWPTDRQAEVLYPGELSCEHLQRIDVQKENSIDVVHGMLGVYGLDIPVYYTPEAFL